MNARWAAVVVNYEAGDALTACVRSILDDTSAGPVEVVVVDNASSDDSVARLRDACPDVPVLETGANRGYAAAANRGIVATVATVIAVCNPDLVVRAGTAAAMLERFAREPDLGALGPRLLNPDGSQYPSARAVPGWRDAAGHGALGLLWPGNPFTRRYRQLDADPDVPRDVDWVSGAAVWLRRRALDDVHGWDDGYFMYVEDVDLCWRLRRAGWRISYEPGGAVVHRQGLSTDRHPYRMIAEHHRSLYRFARKRATGFRWLALPLVAAAIAVRCALALADRAWAGRRAVRVARREAPGRAVD